MTHLKIKNLSNILVSAIFGIITADFLSGLVHWIADTWGSVELPLIGRVGIFNLLYHLNLFVAIVFDLQNFLRPFREHHIDPTSITRHDFIETNGDNFMVPIPFLIRMLWDFSTLSDDEVQKKFTWNCYVFLLALFVAMTNQVKSKFCFSYLEQCVVILINQ